MRWRWILPRVALGVASLAFVAVLSAGLNPHAQYTWWGHDYDTYIGAARDWLAGRGFYEPYQLAGPYRIDHREVLYPPVILPLLVPFTVLPPVLWWLIPLGLVVAIVVAWRPSVLGWAGIVACLAVPITLDFVTTGNPGIWAMAAVAAGTRWGWPSVLVLLKPTVAPFALIGVRGQGWWIAFAGLALLSLALLPLWRDYVLVIANARGPNATPFYSLGRDTTLLLIPVIAWLTRSKAVAAAPSATRRRARGGLGDLVPAD